MSRGVLKEENEGNKDETNPYLCLPAPSTAPQKAMICREIMGDEEGIDLFELHQDGRAAKPGIFDRSSAISHQLIGKWELDEIYEHWRVWRRFFRLNLFGAARNGDEVRGEYENVGEFDAEQKQIKYNWAMGADTETDVNNLQVTPFVWDSRQQRRRPAANMQRGLLNSLHADSSRYVNVVLKITCKTKSKHDQTRSFLYSGLYQMQPELVNGKACYRLQKKVPQIKSGKVTEKEVKPGKEDPVLTEVWLYWDVVLGKQQSTHGQWVLREIVDPTQLKFKGQATQQVLNQAEDGFRGKTFFQWDDKKVPGFGKAVDEYKPPQAINGKGKPTSERESQTSGPTFNVKYLKSDLVDHEDQKEKGDFDFGLSWEEIDQVEIDGKFVDRDTTTKSELLEACKMRKGIKVKRLLNKDSTEGNVAEIFQHNCALTFRHEFAIGKAWYLNSDDDDDDESQAPARRRRRVYDDDEYPCYDGAQPSRLKVSGSKVHRTRMGLYDLLPYGKGGTEKKPKGPRPCYKCHDTGNYLYYKTGYWCISEDPGSLSCALKYRAPSAKLTPDAQKEENGLKEKPKHGIRGILSDPFVGILLCSPLTQQRKTCMQRIKELEELEAKPAGLKKECGKCKKCKNSTPCNRAEDSEKKYWDKLEDGVWFSWKGDRGKYRFRIRTILHARLRTLTTARFV
jgi:hypothetical protein